MTEWKIWQYGLPAGIILLSFIVGVIVRVTIVRRLSRLAEKSKSRLDDVFLDALRSVVILWFVLLGVFISVNILPLTARDVAFLRRVFQSLAIFSVFWFLMQLLGNSFYHYSERVKGKLPAASIIRNAIKIFVLTIGLLIILQTLGISITPVITTLGVGGLAVALALQDTLANIFAGFYIVVSRRVKTSDYIKLDSGEEGYVVDINWRDTVLRQLPGNHIIIPNSKLSSAVVTNYYRPKKAMNVLVEVGVDYTSDLELVERVTVDVARQILTEVDGGDENWEPFVRYHTFDDSSINFTVYLRCKEFFEKFLLQHEFIKRLKKRYDQEGISIPFPIRTVIMKKE